MAETNLGIASTRAVASPSNYVEWGPIIAGVAAAMAVTFTLLSFGAAVGLSSVSPWTSTSTSVKAATIGSAFWLLLVNVWAFALGGYLAARMRHRWNDAPQKEVDFRDGAHGLIVWAVAVSIMAYVAASGAAAVARGAASAGVAAAQSAAPADPLGTAVDTMLRSTRQTPDGRQTDARAEIIRIMTTSVTAGEIPQADRTYMAELVAQRTGVAQPEAEKRVNDTIAKAKSAADTARKTGVVVGFLLASVLLVCAGAAWWGASVGGRHRDEGTIWHGLSARERIT